MKMGIQVASLSLFGFYIIVIIFESFFPFTFAIAPSPFDVQVNKQISNRNNETTFTYGMELVKVPSSSSSMMIKNHCMPPKLISNFFQIQKHINNAIILSCPTSTATAIPSESEQKQQHQQKPEENRLYFITVAKHLMATDMLIKVVDIDSMGYHGILGDSLWKSSAFFKQGVVLHLNCRSSKSILKQVSERKMFNSSYHWLLIDDFSSRFDQTYFNSLDINHDSEIVLAVPEDIECESYKLHDIWNTLYATGGKLRIDYIGYYNQLDGLRVSSEPNLIRRRDFNGDIVRSIYSIGHELPPGMTFDEYIKGTSSRHMETHQRLSYNLLLHVSEVFNFSITLLRTNTWGYLLPNGEWNGVTRALLNGESDIGAPLRCLSYRFPLIECSTMVWKFESAFIFRHPSHSIHTMFIKPFDSYVWYCVMGTAILAIIFGGRIVQSDRNGLAPREQHVAIGKTFPNSILGRLKLFPQYFRYGKIDGTFSRNKNPSSNGGGTQITPTTIYGMKSLEGNKNIHYLSNLFYMKRNRRAHHRRAVDNNFSRNILMVIGTLCQQGFSETPRRLSARCTLMVIILFGFLIFQFYSATITGSLLMKQPKNIKTLRNLVDSSLIIYVENIPYTQFHFDTSNDLVVKDLYLNRVLKDSRLKSESSHYVSVLEGIRYIQIGGYAYHMETSSAYKIIADTFTEKEICDLTEIRMVPIAPLYLPMRKNSPLRKMIQYGFRRTVESGLLHHQTLFWQNTKPKCVRQIHSADLKVGIQAISTALYVLFAGYLLGLVVLIIEIASSKCGHCQHLHLQYVN